MEAKVLTPLQARVLRALFENGIGERGYYFTGGSALAEFYLQHRYSDDLDLFTRSPGRVKNDFGDLKQILTSLEFDILTSDESEEFVRFFVRAGDEGGDRLKVEFARDAKAVENRRSLKTLLTYFLSSKSQHLPWTTYCKELGKRKRHLTGRMGP
ncbi:MAG: nucleotidyl transferase AbiEii/AbiGii toxin family protein [Deltaproteobacteria bacterium]|nr:nucleotidyl transferase AbiEii/AbiGii toxin family protein [Deltaproteobacteria bacterium]